MPVEFEVVTVEHNPPNPWFPHSSIWPRWLRWIEHRIRTRIFRQDGYFIDKWTVEESKDIEVMHGLDLEEELANALQEEIAKEIKENGSYTWAQLCEKENQKHDS